MDPTRLMTRTAVITHRTQSGTADEYGNPTWTSTSETVRCEIQQVRRTEQSDRGVVVTEEWVGFFPPSVDLEATDLITVDGVRYELDGEPWAAHNPRLRRVTHVETTLRRAG